MSEPGLLYGDLLFAVVCSTLIILLLIAGLAVAFLVTSRQRMRQEMALSENKLAFERELRKVETEVTETIMGQFAQELHDNIGQLLTALHIQVENQKLDHPALSDSFKPAEIYIAEINQQLRLLSRTLNHDYIGHIGLAQALETEVRRLNSLKRMLVRFDHNGEPCILEKNVELMIFRMFQEIAQNTLRHAKAKHFFVTLVCSEGKLRLEMRDDGIGFDKDAVLNSTKASGLRNIIKRAQLAALELEFDSTPGNGSLFVVSKNRILA